MTAGTFLQSRKTTPAKSSTPGWGPEPPSAAAAALSTALGIDSSWGHDTPRDDDADAAADAGGGAGSAHELGELGDLEVLLELPPASARSAASLSDREEGEWEES